MTTLQSIIDRLGIPPREVCVDWAWQLQELGHDRSGEANRLGARDALDEQKPHHLRWSDLEVTQSGVLVLRVATADDLIERSRAASPVSANRLVDQLLHWSMADTDIALRPSDRPRSRQVQLRQFTMEIIDSTIGAAGSRHASTLSVDTQPASLPNAIRDSSGAGRQRRKLRGKPKARRRSLVTIVGIVALLMVTALALRSHQLAERRGLAVDRRHSPDATQAGASGLSDKDSAQAELAGQAVQPTEPRDTLDNSTERGVLPEDSLERPTEGAETLEPLLLPEFTLDADSANVAAARASDRESAAQTEITLPPATGGQPAAQSTGQAAGEPVDLMAELDRVLSHAEAESAEGKVDGEISVDADRIVASPLSISTFPMRQVQKLTGKSAARVRKPVWELRLAVGDGLTLSPQQSQTISGREIATWTILDANAERPAAKIMVQAQAASSRGSSILWRVAAGADDLPHVLLPLRKETLDLVQSRLGQLKRMLQLEVDRLQSLGRADGLPSEIRSYASAQRKVLSAQLKLAARILEVVAEANQLEGWLDGQLEVHAQLVDQAAKDSEPLVRFGNVAVDRAPEQTAEESAGAAAQDGFELPRGVSSKE